MVILEFIYKNTPVSVIPFKDLEFCESSKDLIRSMIKNGRVRKPENWDRYEFYCAEKGGVWRG